MRTPKAPAVEIGFLNGGVTPEAPPANALPPVADAAAIPDPAPEPIPDPVTAVGEDGRHRPMSGGSFIRQSDGTLVRSDDVRSDDVRSDDNG
ncbi:MAG: hypothetical protein U5M50_08600 [Sphingobium sp.]|nr:hypothetical protein [Sphingobium sp.]